jgi:FtsZ-interacting cell division protein ZipA
MEVFVMALVFFIVGSIVIFLILTIDGLIKDKREKSLKTKLTKEDIKIKQKDIDIIEYSERITKSLASGSNSKRVKRRNKKNT